MFHEVIDNVRSLYERSSFLFPLVSNVSSVPMFSEMHTIKYQLILIKYKVSVQDKLFDVSRFVSLCR